MKYHQHILLKNEVRGLSGDFHKIAGRKIKYNEKEDKLSKNESNKTEFFVNFSAF